MGQCCCKSDDEDVFVYKTKETESVCWPKKKQNSLFDGKSSYPYLDFGN